MDELLLPESQTCSSSCASLSERLIVTPINTFTDTRGLSYDVS